MTYCPWRLPFSGLFLIIAFAYDHHLMHFIRLALLCLLLGTITTFAVAWTIGYFVQYHDYGASYAAVTSGPIRVDPITGERRGPPGMHLLRYWGFGSEYVIVGAGEWTLVDDTIPDRPSLESVWPAWGPLAGRSPREIFDDVHAEARALQIETTSRGYAARGWPMLALWCEFEHGHGVVSGGIDLKRRTHTPDTFIVTQHVLPWRPHAIGFTIDTLFYGAMWFILIFVPGAAKRYIRRKGGRCPRCGYDLRGKLKDGCPECSWMRPANACESR